MTLSLFVCSGPKACYLPGKNNEARDGWTIEKHLGVTPNPSMHTPRPGWLQELGSVS